MDLRKEQPRTGFAARSWVAIARGDTHGFDYVAHSNVFPYSPVAAARDGPPLDNVMYDMFFSTVRFRQSPGSRTLKFKKKNKKKKIMKYARHGFPCS